MFAELVGALLILTGVFFSVVGVMGILRFPDTYTRLHASGKVSTLGVMFICAGTGVIMPATALKVLALSIFVIFSGPVGSHAIAAAMHRGTAARVQEAEAEGLKIALVSGVHRQITPELLDEDQN